LKYLLGILGAFVLVAGIGLILISTGSMNNEIAAYLNSSLSAPSDTPVRIGKLTGNPLSHFAVENLSVGDARHPIVQARRVEVEIRLSSLLKGELVLDRVVIMEPMIVVKNEGAQDQGWDPGTPPLYLTVNRVEVREGEFRIAASGIEHAVKDVEMEFAFRWSKSGYDLELFRFRTSIFSPSLNISNLAGVTWLRDGKLGIDRMQLATDRSRLELSGSVSGFSAPTFDLEFAADSLSALDLGNLAKMPIPDGNWLVAGSVAGPIERLQIVTRLSNSALNGTVQGILDLNGGFACSLKVSAKGIDVAKLFGNADLNAGGDLSAFATANVRGDTRHGEIKAEISSGHFEDIRISAGVVRLELDGAKLRTTASVGVGNGRIGVKSNVLLGDPNVITSLTSDWTNLDLSVLAAELGQGVGGKLSLELAASGKYVWSGSVEEFSLGSTVLPRLDLSGDFKGGHVGLSVVKGVLANGIGSFVANGRLDLGRFWSGTDEPEYALNLAKAELDPGRISGDPMYNARLLVEGRISGTGLDTCQADLRLSSADFLGAGIDSGNVLVRLYEREILIDRMAIFSSLLSVEAGGKVKESGELAGRVRARLHDPSRLDQFLETEISGAPVDLIGVLEGNWAKPVLAVDMVTRKLVWQDIPFFGVKVSTRWPVLSAGAVSVRVDSAGWAGKQLTGVFLQASQAGDDIAFLMGNSPEDSHRFYLWGKVGSAGSRYTLELDSLSVQAERVSLTNEGKIKMSYESQEGLRIDRLRLAGDSGHIEARQLPDRPNGILVEVSSVDLAIWSFVLGLEQEVEGIFSCDLNLENIQGEPRLGMRFSVDSGHVGGVRFQEVSGNVDYGEGDLNGVITVVQFTGDPVRISGTVPVKHKAVKKDERIDLTIESDRLDLGFLAMISSEIDSAIGTMELAMKVSGTLESPEYNGSFSLEQGVLGIAALNRVFNPIRLKGRVGSSGVFLDSARVGHKKNSMVLDGFVGYGDTGKGEMDLRISARDFELVDLEDISTSLSMNLRLGGTFDAPTIQGNAKLVRAVLQLYSFIETPMDPDSFWTASPFMQRLAGKVRINAHRNVWIRDRDINVEIQGDVDLIKTNEGYRMFGTLNSRRGRYEFQQTNFKIERGELQFQGNPGVNPDLFILGTHHITLYDGQPAIVSVVVGGSLMKPQISLDSDPPLTERDILSYLVTGRSADDIGTMLSGGAAGGTSLEGQAAGLVLGVAANQLRESIGRKLDLDIVEIDMGGEGSRIRVGKYVGSRFFFTYSRELSTAGEQEFTVEYELVPSVTLEAQQRAGTELQKDRQSLGIFWNKEW